MAREKDGYRDALERIRSQAAGELVTVSEAARIVYGPDDTRGKRKVCQQFTGWIGGDHGKRIPATATELFPGELLFGPTKVAKILGRSRAWVYRHYGSFNSMTVEQIASLIC